METYNQTRPGEPKRILVVEDDLSIQPVLERMIHKINPDARVDWTTRAEDALALLTQTQSSRWETNDPYHVVLSDIRLAGEKTGVDLVTDCYSRRISAPIVLTSGNLDFKTDFPFLPKPQRFRDVETCLGPYIKANVSGRLEPLPLLEVLARARSAVSELRITADQQFEWFLFVLSAALVAWLFSSLVKEFRHLPFQPFDPKGIEFRLHETPALDPDRTVARGPSRI